MGAISPDPDGTGALKRRAVRTSYSLDGDPTLVERGTVNGTTDTDWANFASLEAVETAYDSLGRKLTDKLIGGGTVQALTQYSYDAKGRPECAAQRMNPGAFGALPASACSPGQEGSFGPDRIVRTVYDAADQVTEMRSAVGAPDEAAEASSTYTNNGEVRTLTDARTTARPMSMTGTTGWRGRFIPTASKARGRATRTIMSSSAMMRARTSPASATGPGR